MRRRFLQFSLRSALVVTAILSLLLWYTTSAIRTYQQEQVALSKIPNLPVRVVMETRPLGG